MATRLDITHSSVGNRQIMTFSFWCKISSLSNSGNYFPVFHMSVGSDYTLVDFTSNNQLRLLDYNGTDVVTNRKFRDTSAWYHIVVAIDTTQATASNRVKMYVNGVEETSFATSTYPSQNANMSFNNNNLNSIGQHSSATNYYYLGLLSHVHFIDGTQYQASDFGSTDSTTGEWKINTSPSVTYGTNGFFILKDGNSVTDQSGNSNNFTVAVGTLTKTEDCPSNVFATWNPLDGVVSLGNSDFQHGNTKFNSETSTNVCWTRSTLGMTSGKFYFEFKVETIADHVYIGIADRASPNTSTYFGAGALEYGYKSSSGDKKNNGTSTSYGNTWTTGDIVSCAVDLDNLKIYFGKNGTWQNSGDPTSGSTGTGSAYTITAPSLTNNGAYFFCGADGTSSNKCRLLANFGNGYFGTTAVASAGTNASGNGIFEYDVPTGYTALSTKGLNL